VDGHVERAPERLELVGCGGSVRVGGDEQRPSAEADDVAQEAFVTAYRKLGGFRGEATFRTWLLAITWRKAIDRRNSMTRWLRLTVSAPDLGDDGPNFMENAPSRTRSQEEALAAGELQRTLRRLIATLPKKLRDALLLAGSGEYSYEQIGQMIGAPVGTVKWRVSEGHRPDRLRTDELEGEDRLRQLAGADPEQRLRDMDRDGIDAELIFPNKGLSMWATPDGAFAMAQCRVYNDWAWETFGPYNDTLVALACVATADLDGAIAEIQRCAALGFRGLSLPCKPVFGPPNHEDLNYNLREFEPLWDCIEDVDLPITFHVSTGRDPRAARAARDAIAGFVTDPELAELRDTCVLLVSEVVTNALRHTDGRVWLELWRYPDRLRVEVSDETSRGLVTGGKGLLDESGRGVPLMDALSDRWGTAPRGDGKVVWFELDLTTRRAAP